MFHDLHICIWHAYSALNEILMLNNDASCCQAPAPAHSHTGDVILRLESGESFRAHSNLLAWSSTTFAEAIVSAYPHSQPFCIRLDLPGISGQQALLLLNMLYAGPDTPACADKRTLAELQQLATVCRALSCDKLLAIVDNILVKHCSADATRQNVLDLYLHAVEDELPGMQQACAQRVFQMVADLRLPASGMQGTVQGALLLPLLLEAQRLQAPALAEMCKTVRHIDAIMQQASQMQGTSDSDKQALSKSAADVRALVLSGLNRYFPGHGVR